MPPSGRAFARSPSITKLRVAACRRMSLHNKLCKLVDISPPVQVQGCDRRSLPACTTCCAALPRPLGRGAQTYVHRLLRVAAKREGRRKLLRVGTKSQNREYSSVGRALPLQG